MHTITFIGLPKLGMFTFAREIENYANQYGASIRVDPKGGRHSGSVCNHCIELIVANPIVARNLGITRSDYVQVLNETLDDNRSFIYLLIAKGLINSCTLKHNKLDMYSRNAAQVIMSSMLNKPNFHIPDCDVDLLSLNYDVHIDYKSMDKLQHSYNLLNRKESPSASVIKMLTPAEQEAVRKYSKLVVATRDKGRKHITRRLKSNETSGTDKKIQ